MKSHAIAALSLLSLTACAADRVLSPESVSAKAAAAGAPTPIDPSGLNGTYPLCGTDVAVEVSGTEKVIQPSPFRLKVISPNYKVTFTNLATGTVTQVSSTGAVSITAEPEKNLVTLKQTGRTVVFNPESGDVVLRVGNFTTQFDLDGNVLSSEPGNIQDLCPRITR